LPISLPTKIFIDSNPVMYTAGAEHPNKGRSEEFLRRAARGEFFACTSAEVLQEVLHRYSAMNRMDAAAYVFDRVVATCREIYDLRIRDLHLAHTILLDVRGISARDAVHAAVMINNGVEWIASFDRDFDRIPGIRRLEPV
jgi:uncharacterized protein